LFAKFNLSIRQEKGFSPTVRLIVTKESMLYINMKKFLKAALLVVVVAVAGYGAYEAQCEEIQLSETMLANVEAIADSEIEIGVICVTTCADCWCYYVEDDLWVDGEPWNN